MHWGRETVGSTLYGISVSNIAKVNSNNNNNKKKKPYFSLPSPCFHLKTTTIIKIAQERERAHVCIFGVWPYIFIVVPQRPHINRVIRPWCFSEIIFVYVSIAVMIVLLFTLLHFLLLFGFFFFFLVKEALPLASLNTFTISLGQMGPSIWCLLKW